jgi:hypothetical protein
LPSLPWIWFPLHNNYLCGCRVLLFHQNISLACSKPSRIRMFRPPAHPTPTIQLETRIEHADGPKGEVFRLFSLLFLLGVIDLSMCRYYLTSVLQTGPSFRLLLALEVHASSSFDILAVFSVFNSFRFEFVYACPSNFTCSRSRETAPLGKQRSPPPCCAGACMDHWLGE